MMRADKQTTIFTGSRISQSRYVLKYGVGLPVFRVSFEIRDDWHTTSPLLNTEVRLYGPHTSNRGTQSITGFYVTSTSQAPPAMVHVNSEARDVGLRHYELRMFDHTRGNNNKPFKLKEVYYNPEVDIVYLNVEWFPKYPGHRIPHLALNAEKEPHRFADDGRWTGARATQMSNITAKLRIDDLDITGWFHSSYHFLGVKEIFFVAYPGLWFDYRDWHFRVEDNQPIMF